MTLTAAPPRSKLPDLGVPFVVYALWHEQHPGADELTRRIAIANVPGGPLYELAVAGSLAEPLTKVFPEELPIVLALAIDPDGPDGPSWCFEFQGTDPAAVFASQRNELQPAPPAPLGPEELNAGAETQLRESLGIPDGQPLPEPAGELTAAEASEEPYRFDPTRHMDLSAAEPAPPLPPPAPPGPPPEPGAQLGPQNTPPPPSTRDPGAYGDQTVPFAH
jgi:hypothetical protein